MKIKMIMKNCSHRYKINRPRTRNEHKFSKYKKCHTNDEMIIYIKQHLTTFKAQFMKTLSNTEAEMKKSFAYKKKLVVNNELHHHRSTT